MVVLVSLKPTQPINLNTLARRTAHREGGKVNLPIAQVEEVQAHALDLLAEEFHTNPGGVVRLLRDRHDNKVR
jgi:hypothetical protein